MNVSAKAGYGAGTGAGFGVNTVLVSWHLYLCCCESWYCFGGSESAAVCVDLLIVWVRQLVLSSDVRTSDGAGVRASASVCV